MLEENVKCSYTALEFQCHSRHVDYNVTRKAYNYENPIESELSFHYWLRVQK